MILKMMIKIDTKYIAIPVLLLALFAFAGTVHAQAPPPTLISPEDGATNLPTTITFEWSSVSNADRYQIQIANDPSFSGSSIVFSDITTSTSITITGFNNDTRYYWRLRSGTDNPLLGGTTYGDWSSVSDFTTVEAPPTAPTLVSPQDGASDVSTSPLLDWNSANRADTYQLQVAQNSSFSSPLVNRNGITTTESEVSDLQSTTTYYWRVRATNNGGTGNWSEVWSFTTTEAPPPPVQLTAPGDGSSGVTTTPRLDWEVAERADYYDLQVATDQNFSQKEVSLNNVTSTHYDAELNGFTTYYWRVRGENQSGPGEWSQVWQFTTEQTGNEISIISPTKGVLWKAGVTASIRWTATNNIENVTIEYRLSSDESWSTISQSVGADSSPYAWNIPDGGSPSPETLIRITDTNNPDIQTTSDPFIIYPSSLQIQQTYSFNSASSTSDYKLIGLPANSNSPLDEIMQGQPADDWNAYYDNGEEENYMTEFDGSERFTTGPGRAFFVISKSEVSVSENAQSVTLASDTTYAIPLQPGWNMIANPFGIAVPWANVQAKNSITSTLWGFEGQFTEATQFEPYKGYYFYNQDNLDVLSIPYKPAGQSKNLEKEAKVNEQILTLSLLQDGSDKSSVQVGFVTGTNNGDSKIYEFAPPGDFQDQKLTIESKEFTGRKASLYKLVLPEADNKHTFSIRLKSKEERPLELKAGGIENFTGQEIRLINQQTGKSYDLKQTQELFVNTEQEYTNYLLVIGTPGEVEELQKSTVPQKLTLAQNYPNPFNGQTVIEYSVPENRQNSPVKLEIFNVIGQRVSTLVNEQKSPGTYVVRWNPLAENGQSLASGVYYYRLQVGETAITKKLTLIE